MLTPDYAAARRYAQAMMLHTGRRYVLWQVEGSRRRALGTYVPGTSPGVDDTREEEPR
jgi:hypothetical protein